MQDRTEIEKQARLNSRSKEDSFLEIQLDVRDILFDIRKILIKATKKKRVKRSV